MKLRHLVRIALSLVLLLIFVAYIGGALRLGLLEQLEHDAYDARVRLTMPRTMDPRIVIVDIDDRTLREEGYPIPRDRYAELVTKLFDRYGVKLVAFDIYFADPDRGADLAVLRRLASGALRNDASFLAQAARLRPQLERDRIFADSLRHRPVVLGYVFSQSGNFGGGQGSGELPVPALSDVQSRYPRLGFPRASGYVGNLPVLAEAAAAQGYFSNPFVDDDGVFRRIGLLQEYRGNLYVSLDVAVLQVLAGGAPLGFVFDADQPASYDNAHLDALRIGPYLIPVDRHMAALVPYRGYARSFPYVSAADVMAGRAPRAVLRNAIVYVGTSAPGLLDLRSTPVGAVYPGVEVHANFLSGALDGRIMQAQPQYARGAEVLLLLLLAVLVTWLSLRSSVLTSSLATLALAALIVAGNLLVWRYGHFVFALASPLAFLVVLFVLQSLYGFFIESRGKRHLSRMFSQYIPPELVEEMDERQEGYSMESDNRELTVLFSDVREFTSIAEKLNPKELSRLMNEFLTPMTRVIHQHRGTIDKYMGDAIMAFWGAPLRDPEHARHAVEAALDMQRTLARLNADFTARGWPALRMGIGLNSGAMSVGDMGSEFRRAYTVMGDAVNLGSRLEGLTKQYGTDIVCSETVRAALPDYAFLELDRVRVKGKGKPVAIYEPLGPRAALDGRLKALLARHTQALACYRAQQWDSAEREFFALQQAFPERPLYRLYLDRIAGFRTQPPQADWDGVYSYSTK